MRLAVWKDTVLVQKLVDKWMSCPVSSALLCSGSFSPLQGLPRVSPFSRRPHMSLAALLGFTLIW